MSDTGSRSSGLSGLCGRDQISVFTGKKDVEQLLTIKNLLYGEMFTIAGARKRLTDINRGKGNTPQDESGKLIDIKRKLREIKEVVS